MAFTWSHLRVNRHNWPIGVRVSEQSNVCRFTKREESEGIVSQESLLKQKAKRPSMRGSFAFKRNIWDGGSERTEKVLAYISSKISWWSAFWIL